jgi:FlaA1/EpsC-like NDP-sugar epimerase
MKTVNMLDLANMIGDGIEIIGKRPGEKLNEMLISKKELPYTADAGDGYVYISTNKQDINLTKEHSSANAEKMTEQEMKDLIWKR